MKAIMYHYVRPDPADMPHFRHLAIEAFRRQLDYFAGQFGFVEKSAFLGALDGGPMPAGGIVLTFDDGFTDHHDWVVPELLRRGLWGLFYVATGPYRTGRLLDVHRVHHLLGRHGGPAMLAALESKLTPAMLLPDRVEEFERPTYSRQTNDHATVRFKRVLNYFIHPGHREQILGELVGEFLGDEAALARSLYMSVEQLAAIHGQGMIVGSHSVSHPVFSTIPVERQRSEIEDSFAFLDDAVGGLSVRTFAYPYGGFHSFTAETERLLGEAGCRFSFNVDPRDVTSADLATRPQALPRWDCNQYLQAECR